MVAWYWSDETRRAAVEQTLDLTRRTRRRSCSGGSRSTPCRRTCTTSTISSSTTARRACSTSSRRWSGPAVRVRRGRPRAAASAACSTRSWSANPWVDFGMDLGLGRPADRKATAREATFLPQHLMEYVATGTLDRGDGPQPARAPHRGADRTGRAPRGARRPPCRGRRCSAGALLAAGVVLTGLDARAGRRARRVFDTALYGVARRGGARDRLPLVRLAAHGHEDEPQPVLGAADAPGGGRGAGAWDGGAARGALPGGHGGGRRGCCWRGCRSGRRSCRDRRCRCSC